ncbi:unnamed protein product [Dicrocoelium dendriticum]|nr:unnamed protein product [Dicrocoelium dendriticum]
MNPNQIIANIMVLPFILNTVKADTFVIPMKYDENGTPYVESDGRMFSCAVARTAKYRDQNGCEVTLEITPPNYEQFVNRKGYVFGSRLCENEYTE